MLAPSSDRILVELFQILKDDAVESAALNMQFAICTQYAICRFPSVHQKSIYSKASSEISQNVKEDKIDHFAEQLTTSW